MNHVNQLRHTFGDTTWAIQPETLRSMASHIEMWGKNPALGEAAVQAVKHNAEVVAVRNKQIAASTGGAVAVLPLYGLITQRSSWMSYFFGGTTTEGFAAQFRQALADPNVTAIVIDVDSPGGSVAGVDELASEIYAARGKKTIVAISDTLNASAAYYLSAQASELWASPSSLTGSIGVYNAHEDDSKYFENVGVKFTLISAGKYKVEGNSYEPLSEDAKGSMQAMVDGYYNAFVRAVAKGRAAKMDEVRSGFGQGRVLMAADALEQKLVDKIGTLDALLAKFGVKRTGSDMSMASAATGVSAKAAVNDDHVDDNGEDELDPCDCTCKPCADGDCDDCTTTDCSSDTCLCDTAKKNRTDAKVAATATVALQRQRMQFDLDS